MLPAIILLDQSHANLYSAIAGSIVITIDNSLSLRKYQEYWINYRKIAESLKYEKIMYLTKSGPYMKTIDPLTPFRLLIERLELIISLDSEDFNQLNNNQSLNSKN